MTLLQTDWDELTAACRRAMQLAAQSPGRYGGRYVARKWNAQRQQTEFFVLDDDDPERYRDDEALDILAQVTPTKVYGIGRARHWLREDGTVWFPER